MWRYAKLEVENFLEETYTETVFIKGNTVFHGGWFRRRRMKRETGASPVRSRHCDREPAAKRPLGQKGSGKAPQAVNLSQETCQTSGEKTHTVYMRTAYERYWYSDARNAVLPCHGRQMFPCLHRCRFHALHVYKGALAFYMLLTLEPVSHRLIFMQIFL